MNRPDPQPTHRLGILLSEAADELSTHLDSDFVAGLATVLQSMLDEAAKRLNLTSLPPALRLVQPYGRSPLIEKILREVDETGARLLGRPPAPEDLAGAYDAARPAGESAGPRIDRRATGRYATPPVLAAELARHSVASPSASQTLPTVLDPATGGGMLLLEALRSLAPKPGKRRRAAAQKLYGVDRDDLAIRLCRALVWLETGAPKWNGSHLLEHFRTGDALLASRDEWADWFPEVLRKPEPGFSLVLSNPPWNAVRSLRSEFVAGWSGDSGQVGTAWAAHLREQRDYAAALAAVGHFQHQAGGADRDLYKYFLELIFQLLRHDGTAGLLIPSAFLRTAGAQRLRRLYLDNGGFDVLVEFMNRRRLFPIHSMFRFTLGVYRRGGGPGVTAYHVGVTHPEELGFTSRPVTLSPEFLRIVSGDLQAIPEVRGADDASLLERLHRRHPGLGESGSWGVRFKREVDMTLDRSLFVSTEEAEVAGWSRRRDGVWLAAGGERYVPVVEGRMLQQYDAAAKSYVEGVGRRATWKRCDGLPRPQYLLADSVANTKRGRAIPRAGFCDISGHANERTVLAALLPTASICGNKVPTVRFEDEAPSLHLYWIAVANSFTFDWLIRRWVSTTLNFFYWRHVPFPQPPHDDPRLCKIAVAAARLSPVAQDAGWSESASPANPWARALLRAEIDSEVAALFGVTPDEYEHVLRDFPLLDRGQPPIPGERASTITRDLAWLSYLEARGRHCKATVRRVAAAREAGATPYVPSMRT